MWVVGEAPESRIRFGAQAAAGFGRALERQGPQARARKVSLGDERVMAGAEEDVVLVLHEC